MSAPLSSPTPSPYTLASSPGKVLLAGGYLVLSPAYPGLVVGTDSRFYSLVVPAAESSTSSSTPVASPASLTIHSPQFQHASWTFHFDAATASISLSAASAHSEYAGKSPFLWLSLMYALTLALQKRGKEELARSVGQGLDVWVLADNDFYSQRKDDTPSTSEYLRSLPPFRPLGCAISKVHKTGLGSSAALTTSLVSALLVHLGVVSRSLQDEDLALLHNAAQLAHCAAQGKVGSGFDVSSAVWGSQVYRRFDPLALEELLKDIPKCPVAGEDAALHLDSLPELASHLDPRHPLWQPSPLSAAAPSTSSATAGAHPTAFEGLHYTPATTKEALDEGSAATAAPADPSLPSIPRPAPLELPPRIEMLLADVDAGSNTPSLVGKVNDWRRRKPEWAAQLYSVIATSNQSLADALLALSMAHAADAEGYHAALDAAASERSKAWPAPSPSDDAAAPQTHLTAARNALRSIRAGMRELGKLSGAPIEPDEMGRLIQSVIDSCPGVVGGGVPGAGGYDALYVLYIAKRGGGGGDGDGDGDEARAREVEQALLSRKEKGLDVGVLLSRSGAAKGDSGAGSVAGARAGGLRLEDPRQVKGLAERVGRVGAF